MIFTVADKARFLREQLPYLGGWPDGRLEDFLQWHEARGLTGTVYKGRRIVAFGVARLFTRGDKRAERPYFHDNGGDTVEVAFAAAITRPALMALWSLLLQRLGRPTWIAWRRWYNGHPMRYQKFERVFRMLSRPPRKESSKGESLTERKR